MTKLMLEATLNEIARETESVSKICETFDINRSVTSSDTIYGIACGYILGRLDQICQSDISVDMNDEYLKLERLIEDVGCIEEFRKTFNLKRADDATAAIVGYASNGIKRIAKEMTDERQS